MWNEILQEFSDSPSQTVVVKFLLETGLSVNESGKITCNGVEIPATHLSRILKTDRRVVDATAKRIISLPEVKNIFANLRVTPDLSNTAEHLGLHLITIYPKDAAEGGIVGAVVTAIVKHSLSIRQIFVTDSQLSENPRMVVIVDTKPPSELYDELRELPQVRRIIL